MAARQEEFVPYGAEVYRFPVDRARKRARKAAMLARRRRAGASLVVIAVVVATLLAGGSAPASRPGAPRAVVVESGGTLWGIAQRYAPEGIDKRAYVDAVVELNDLSGPPRAGQRIVLPR
ncbi:MAG TPA: LysM peptidoglycan-binding domain-containing protein [Actinomycetota bacterium]|nr:LysM peptidoglycan-binding domain-containing protein [Actinomycetota bacterium]